MTSSNTGRGDRWASLRRSIAERAADIDTPADEFPGDKLIWLSNLSGCIAQATPALLAERDELAAEVERLREGLSYYTDRDRRRLASAQMATVPPSASVGLPDRPEAER